MEYFLIYLLVMLDQFRHSIGAAGILSGCSVLLFCVVYAIVYSEVRVGQEHPMDKYKVWPKRALVVFVTSACISALLPDTKKAAIILGGGLVVSAVTSEKGQQVAGRISGALEEKLYQILSVKPEETNNLGK